jgi:Zn-dependent peptidase ImmA (M78 family)
MRFPTGINWVVMNPNHQSTRQRATLMEELAHVHLNHRPTDLMNAGSTGFFRSFNKSHEKEAYWVGAAALLPRRVLKGAKTLGLTAGDIASRHQVSHELVRFRENITGVKLLQNSDQDPPREAISTT